MFQYTKVLFGASSLHSIIDYFSTIACKLYFLTYMVDDIFKGQRLKCKDSFVCLCVWLHGRALVHPCVSVFWQQWQQLFSYIFRQRYLCQCLFLSLWLESIFSRVNPYGLSRFLSILTLRHFVPPPFIRQLYFHHQHYTSLWFHTQHEPHIFWVTATVTSFELAKLCIRYFLSHSIQYSLNNLFKIWFFFSIIHRSATDR